MQITVYNSEKFERTKRRYVIFSSIFASVFILSILNKNIVGAILLFFLLWAYFYYSVSSNQLTKINITKQWLIIWPKTYNWTSFKWYILEVDEKEQILKNIIFLTNKWHTIHTFHDNMNNIKDFVVLLNDYIPMMEEFQQTFLERLSRNLQL